MALVAITGDPVSGTCNGHFVLGVQTPQAYTGTWTATAGGLTAGGANIVRMGDQGPASCGHTFQAMDGSPALTGPGGIGIHKRGGAVNIIDNGGLGGPGITGSGASTPPLSCT
jgi:hypothetical protein